MLISEVFNTKVPYNVHDESASHFSAVATIKGRKIAFVATEMFNDDVWEVEFSEVTAKARMGITYDLTGSGGEFEVFAFVRQALDEFVERYHPRVIRFSADKPGGSTKRADLYQKVFAKQLSSRYEAKISDGSRVNFWLERRDSRAT